MGRREPASAPATLLPKQSSETLQLPTQNTGRHVTTGSGAVGNTSLNTEGRRIMLGRAATLRGALRPVACELRCAFHVKSE